MIVTLITTNEFKARELEEKLRGYGIKIQVSREPKIEVQSDDLQAIVETAVKNLTDTYETPLLIEDSGLFVEELGGFPGPYSSYVYRKIGLHGILKLMEGTSNRHAEFQSVITVKKPGQPLRSFRGRCGGVIAEVARGSEGFGFDPIFIPEGGRGRTFAEMSLEEKNLLSHRAKAAEACARWLTSKTPV